MGDQVRGWPRVGVTAGQGGRHQPDPSRTGHRRERKGAKGKPRKRARCATHLREAPEEPVTETGRGGRGPGARGEGGVSVSRGQSPCGKMESSGDGHADDHIIV